MAITINTSTKNTLPSAGSSFEDDVRTFLAEEEAERFDEIFESVVISGGTHPTGAGLAHSPTQTIAYVAGFYVSESGQITYADSETTWVAVTKDTTTTPSGNFTRVSGTHYAIDSTSATRPAAPTGGTLLMQVTTASGAVSAVLDIRTTKINTRVGWSYSAKTASYTILESDELTLFSFDATSGNLIATLPPAADVGANFVLGIKKSDSSANTVTIDGNASETIDGAATIVISDQYNIYYIISNGTNWEVISSHGSGLENVVEDTTPQLGGVLDTNSNTINESKNSDLASASTVSLANLGGNYVEITGTTTITSFGTVTAGARRIVRFTGALILTYNATSLILPTNANITTVAGDTATFVSLGSGNWVCTEYQRDSGQPLTTELSSDTTPQLGGTLDANSFAINEAKGSDIASATTTDIGAAAGNYVEVTGTTTITGLGTVAAGTRRVVRFTGALLLTYNAVSLILPSAADITTVADDRAEFISLGSGNWICVNYMRASGASVAGDAATQAEQEAATSVVVFSTPGRQHFHPSAAKAWGNWNSSGTLAGSYNIASVTDNGVGDFTVNWDTDFSSTAYAAFCNGTAGGAAGDTIFQASVHTAGTISVTSFDGNNAAGDWTANFVVAFGDQ